MRYGKEQGQNKPSSKIAIQVCIFGILLGVLGFIVYRHSGATLADTSLSSPTAPQVTVSAAPQETPTPEPTIAPTPTPEPTPPPFEPYHTEATNPDNYINQTDIMVDGTIIEGEYEPTYTIDMGEGDEYTKLKGITTFRGNNFRDGGSYGTADIVDESFDVAWTKNIGSLTSPDGAVWTGSGWTGQPLIVEWPKSTREVMNMYDWAKEKETLTEVIYATMDGNIYFMELETGEPTRDNMRLGFTVKGTATVDPRGYPILYVGAGYNSNVGISRAFVISLIDFSIMYEYGLNETFAIRQWSMFDASPIVDAMTDTLIHPGENGIVYIISLNSQYDEEAGTVSVDPDRVVKWRYNGVRTNTYSYWLGFEASPVVWQGHIFLPDNGANLICLDLNTLEIKWVQDILDDSNSTPVLELEDGHPYLYLSTSFHAGWRAPEYATADIPIWKIDAVTGEIVWSTSYECYTVSSVSGGVQGSIASGKGEVSHLIYVPVARTPQGSTGEIVALDKTTGEEVWSVETQMYSWSSPVLVYDDSGKAYIIYCTSGSYVYLLDALTGEKLEAMDVGGNVEATPAVYENYVVVGHRGQQIHGIKLT